MKIHEKVAATNAAPGPIHARQMEGGAVDLATAVHLHIRAVCDRLGPNVCPYRENISSGYCPAGWEPCPHSSRAGKPLSREDAIFDDEREPQAEEKPPVEESAKAAKDGAEILATMKADEAREKEKGRSRVRGGKTPG